MKVYAVGEQISGVDEFGEQVTGTVVNYGTSVKHTITGYEVAHEGGQSHVYVDQVVEADENQLSLLDLDTPEPAADTDVRAQRLFQHKRFITLDRQPELCRVTKVVAGTVYYRAGVQNGAHGNKFYCSVEYFLTESLGSWVEV